MHDNIVLEILCIVDGKVGEILGINYSKISKIYLANFYGPFD